MIRADEYRPSRPTPPWMFHVATVSVAALEAGWVNAASASMHDDGRGARCCPACAQDSPDRPCQREDCRHNDGEYGECRRRGLADGGDGSIDENRRRDHAGCQSKHGSDEKIAPADVR